VFLWSSKNLIGHHVFHCFTTQVSTGLSLGIECFRGHEGLILGLTGHSLYLARGNQDYRSEWPLLKTRQAFYPEVISALRSSAVRLFANSSFQYHQNTCCRVGESNPMPTTNIPKRVIPISNRKKKNQVGGNEATTT